MNSKNKTTEHLASLVHQKLMLAKNSKTKINQKILKEIFNTLFFTSLRTEEGQLIQVVITFINPENQDPTPPETVTSQRWSCIKFDEIIPFNVKNLTKLSKAADPWSSSLALFYNKQELYIWGMIDQAIHNQSYLNYEITNKPDQPGLFQASINGIGNIQVMIDYELIANLKQNTLISSYIDAFSKGPIGDILKENFQSFKENAQNYIDAKFKNNTLKTWEKSVDVVLKKSISRILIRIQNYHHGGAILITKNGEHGLNIKHKLNYKRLHNSINRFIEKHIDRSNYATRVKKLVDKDSENLSIDLFTDFYLSEEEMEQINNEIKGAIRFISSLSCIDGLVILTPDLKVSGFGTVIETYKLPDFVYLSDKSIIKDESLVPTSPDHFGTRHRSMFSYCWNNSGSLGFVVSQDGDIRAI